MSNPVRVLQIFAALDSGGVSNFVMNIYREMDPRIVQFDFALTSGKKTMYDDEVVARGGRVFYFDPSKSLVANLRQILKQKGPYEAIHSHIFFYSGLMLAEARREKIPIRIAHAHNAYTGEPRSAFRIAYERGMQMLIRANATCLLGCSEKACRYVFGVNIMKDSRSEVMPDGIDFNRFAFNQTVRDQVRKEYGIEGKYVVGHVGHFNHAKNHEKILSVFDAICKQCNDAVLLLVGDGELELKIKQRSERLGLIEKVVFAGAHKDVERFYQAMDVFLFPSRYEGFGMAMIEAQASGLSCIASDVVPRETNITGFAKYLSLSASDEEWATVVCVNTNKDRGTVAGEIHSRYALSRTTEEIKKIYLHENDQRDT